MTKQTYRQSKRLSPLGTDGIDRIREILQGHQHNKVNEVMVDAFSASAIIAVYDNLNEENKAKLVALPVVRVADICFKVINKK